VELSGVDDVERLAGAWRRVIRATPVLRTTVVWEGLDSPVQVVHQNREASVTVHDRRHCDRDTALREFLAEDRAREFRLADAPPVRAGLVRLAGGRVVVVWTFHHLLLDKWSLPLVLSDVFAAYAGEALPRRRPFADHLEWLSGRDTESGLAYWRRVLEGVEGPTALPYDQAPRDVRTARSTARLPRELSVEQTRRLRDFARSRRITLNTLVQGAWALVLSAWSGQRDVVFGATTSGRRAEVAGMDSAVGLFINTLPVRVGVEPGVPVVRWLRALQEAQLEAREYDHVPLHRIQAETLGAQTPLFDSLVVFENYPVDTEAARAHGITVERVDADEATNYPLTLAAYDGDHIRLLLGHDPSAFHTDTAHRLLSDLVDVLAGLAADPDAPLGRLRRTTAAPGPDVVHGPQAQPPTRSVTDLFAAQAAERPDAPALVWDGGALSYAEL